MMPARLLSLLERLIELVAIADRALSELEVRLAAGDLERAGARLPDTAHAVARAAGRYLETVDGLPTTTPVEAVRTARHTGLLGADEADLLEPIIRDGSPPMDARDAPALRHAARILRVWLERVRDTAKKAVEPPADGVAPAVPHDA